MILQNGTLELSGSRLRQNLDLLRGKLAPHSIICPTIKANAYGHSAHHINKLLVDEGLEWRCAYTLLEALGIVGFPSGKTTPLKVLALAPIVGEFLSSDLNSNFVFTSAVGHRVRFTLVDVATAHHINALLEGVAEITERIPVHVQIDTGLTRCGMSLADAPEALKQILRFPKLQLEGIFTHLSHGDAPGHASMEQQIAALHQIADPIKRDHPHLLIHAQNSGGTWHFPDNALDMVRVGIAMYGLQPSLDDPVPSLLPIARLVAPILMIHDRPANTGVGYGHTFITQRPSRLGIVPVGYADGYPRALSNRGIVQVRGQNAPVVGRVSMDQIIIDVTDVPSAAPGDQVIVFSNDPAAPNCIDRIAKACDTIGYEIATGMGARLARQIVD